MRKRLLILGLLAAVCCVAAFAIKTWLGVLITITIGVGAISVVLFFVLNKLIRHTNWWKNQYVGITQFVSNAGYRDNIIRNYDIINLGSNPARFAFFYEGVKGQSWATGSQGSDMDLEILRYYHSYLKEGGTVLIPIMPFTAISPYLKEQPEYWGVEYYSKFVQILDSSQVETLSCYKDVQKYLRYPLLINKLSILSLIHDSEPDTRFLCENQPMMTLELQQDASNWIKMWLKEFGLKNLNDVLAINWDKYYQEAISINKQIVKFCLERKLSPVFICAPMTKHLSDLFPVTFWERMVSGFVSQINEYNVPFLDYTYDERFQDDSLYMNSYFLNMRGRKRFTHQVLFDLGLVK